MSFPEKPSISSVLSLKDYLVRTASLRAVDANNMFIQLKKPHKSVSSQTLACWITNIMANNYSASAAWLETGTKKMSVAQICRQAQWSNLTTTYRKFYHQAVLHTGLRLKSSEWAGWKWEDCSK